MLRDPYTVKRSFTADTVDLDGDAAFELVRVAAEGQLDVEPIAARLAVRDD